MKRFLSIKLGRWILFGVVASMLVGVVFAAESSTAQRPPNVLVILVDDLGWADLSSHGSPDIRTPNLDALAASGARFSSGYVTASVCGPSRAAIMTGRYHERLGISGNKNADAGLPLSVLTMGDHMREHGYRTIAIGKWHLGLTDVYHPLNRGFDEFFGFLEGGMNFLPFSPAHRKEDEPKLLDDWTEVTLAENRYLTDELAAQAVDRIRRHQKSPWFMYLSFNAPHAPLVATPGYEARNHHIADPKRRTFAGMMTALDDGVGRVMAELDSLDLAENTLVFFLSDNGGPTAKTTSRNDPYRGVKGDIFEGGIRVPFFARWIGKIEGGQQIDHPVQSLDLLPTMLAVAGTTAPLPAELDGANLLPLLQGQVSTASHEWIYFNRHGRQALRDERHKLIVGGPDDSLGLFDLSENQEEDPERRLEDDVRTLRMQARFDSWWEDVMADQQSLSAPAQRSSSGHSPPSPIP
jgi:arylsulfatase A-like enzyme